jgi:hypothetical protein
MSVISGNISGSIKNVSYNIPCTIQSFSLWNRSGGSVVVNIGIVQLGVDRYVYSANLAAVGTTGSSVIETPNIKVPKDCQILIVASGSVDYYFSID